MGPARGATLRAVDSADARGRQPEVGVPVDRAEKLQERLAVPVLIAALASIPAVFLTLFDDPARTAGTVLNTLSGAVLVAEVVVLFVVSDRKITWLKRNRWLVGTAALMAPAVILAVGPVQLFRLVKVVGALRIIRVGRILKAGRIVRERAGLHERWQKAIGFGVTLLVAVFVGAVLSDPTSHSRQVLDGAVSWLGITGVLLAGAVLAIATYLVRSTRGRGTDAPTREARPQN
jgi:CsoR family transcriptional regulator, copper-sensing transcriptional repressor